MPLSVTARRPAVLHDAGAGELAPQPEERQLLLLRLDHAIEGTRRRDREEAQQVRRPHPVAVAAAASAARLAAQVDLRDAGG